LLSPAEKEKRVRMAREILDILDKRRISDVVTGDETWMYFYQAARKSENMVWLSEDEPRPGICRPSFRSKKRMFTIFINYRGPLCIDVLPEDATINGNYYATVILPQLVDGISEQRPKMRSTRLLLHHDNAAPHGTKQVKDYIASQGIQIMPHPPYSPDLAPMDFWVFPKLKSDLSGIHFSRIQDLAKAVKSQLEAYGEDWFREGLEKWKERLEKCIAKE
jgi:[histone H3]-lysine36 N-dimethyltransferase SETMAR